MQIKTNNQPRPVLKWWQLTPKQQKQFDHDQKEEGDYFIYRGWVYTLDDFIQAPPDLAELGWFGQCPDSYFSGVVIKFVEDFDYLIVGTYYC